MNLIVISLTFEYMINSALSVHGSFWFYAGLTFIGFIFCLAVIKETKGLTDL